MGILGPLDEQPLEECGDDYGVNEPVDRTRHPFVRLWGIGVAREEGRVTRIDRVIHNDPRGEYRTSRSGDYTPR